MSVFRLALRSLLCISAAAYTPAQADTLDDVTKAGVIRIAVTLDFPPFGVMGRDMKHEGYDWDVAILLAKDMGLKLEAVPVTPANRIPFLQTKKVDVIISAMGKTPDREKAIDFTRQPYAALFAGIFGPKELAVSKPADLAGKSVAVVRGTTQDLDLTSMAPLNTQIRRFEDNNSAFTAYLTGQVQLIATGTNLLNSYATKFPSGKPEQKIPLTENLMYIGVTKGDARIRERMDTFLTAKRQTGELDALSKKWFGAPLPPQKQ